MGIQAGVVSVAVAPDTTAFAGTLQRNVSQAAAQSAGAFQGLGKKIGLGLIGGFAAVQVGRKIAQFIGDSIEAASDQIESINKAREVFDEFGNEIVSWSEGTASAMGIAQAEALDMSANFGQMFQVAGIATGRAAEMSQAMVQLASDMASFNNQDPSEMLARLQSGLAGQARPLRQFGVFLSEAAVQEFALANGIIETDRAMTDSEKILARYGLIMEHTATQQGDFLRTLGESVPNQMRVFRAELTDAQAELGKALLPVLKDLVGFARDHLIPALKLVADHLDVVVAILIGMATSAAIRALPGILMGIAGGLEAIGAAKLASGLASIAAGLSSIPGLFVTASAAALAWGVAQDNARRKTKEFMERTTGLTLVSLDFYRSALLAKDGTVVWSGSAADARDKLAELAHATQHSDEANRSWVRTVDGMAPAIKAAHDRLKQLNEELNESISLALQQAGGAVGIIETGRRLAEAQATRAAAQQRVNRLEREGAEGTKRYRNAVKELEQANQDVLSIGTQLAGQMLNFEGSFRDARGALEAVGTALGLNKREMRPFIRALRDAWGDAKKVNEALETFVEGGPYKAQVALEGIQSSAAKLDDVIGKLTRLDQGMYTADVFVRTRHSPSVEERIEAISRALDALTKPRHEIQVFLEGHEQVVNQLQRIVDRVVKGLERGLDRVKDRLGEMRDLARDFASGISSLASISGGLELDEEGALVTAPLEFLAGQLAQARQLSSVLRALAAQGASQALLAQIAGEGPEAIAFAQRLLQGGPSAVQQASAMIAEIEQIASSTGRALSEQFFGETMGELKDELRGIRAELRESRRAQRRIEGKLTLTPDSAAWVRGLIRQELAQRGV